MQNISSKSLWIGNKSNIEQADILAIDFINNKEIRIAHEYHRKYTQIFFCEYLISNYHNWPIILDEIFRLADRECTYSFNFSLASPYFSVAKFYKLIYKISQDPPTLISFKKINEQGEFNIQFKATSKKYVESKHWTFALIWDGKKEENLEKFISSVENQLTSENKYEIIICGPQPIHIDEKRYIHILPDDETEKYANISKKKNLITEHAKYENICIAHNRYMLSDNFIKSFDKFGYDFDICVVPQIFLSNGQRVPDWVSQGSDQKICTNFLLEYGDYSPYQYIPGGIYIAKTEILLKNKFNELATWNMAEDVELSQRLLENGITPRLNFGTSVYVLNLRKEIFDDFKKPNMCEFYTQTDFIRLDDDIQHKPCHSNIFRKIKNFIRAQL